VAEAGKQSHVKKRSHVNALKSPPLHRHHTQTHTLTSSSSRRSKLDWHPMADIMAAMLSTQPNCTSNVDRHGGVSARMKALCTSICCASLNHVGGALPGPGSIRRGGQPSPARLQHQACTGPPVAFCGNESTYVDDLRVLLDF